MFKDTVLLVVAEADNDKYIPAVLENVDQFWPGHPDYVIATDGDLPGLNAWQFSESTYLRMLAGAVRQIRKDHPQARYVFLLQDKYCPLAPVDTAMLEAAMQEVVERDLKYVLFQWPGDFRIALDAKVSPSIVADGIELDAMKPNWEAVNSLAPAIWEIDHLSWIVETKISQDYSTTRHFQQPMPGNTAVHYMKSSGWPTLDHGFAEDGQINPKAVTRKYFPVSALVSQLRVDYCGEDNLKKARRKYGVGKIAHRFHERAERRRKWKELIGRKHTDGPAAVFDDTVLLVTTYSRNEHYIPAIRETIGMLWPGHPECVIATDGDLDTPETIRFEDVSFVELLVAAVRKIKKDRPNTRHVFLMLEDLCPLWPVDTQKVETAMLKVRKHGLKYVLFPWPGEFSWTFDRTSAPTFVGPEVELVPMQKDWEAPNSLVTAIWEIDHLLWLAEQKLAVGINDPWGFEHALPQNPHPHYMQMNGWPTVQDGFFVRGELNPLAVTNEKFPPTPIAAMLRKEYCGVNNLQIARLKYGLTALSGRVKERKERKRGLNAKPTEMAKSAGDL